MLMQGIWVAARACHAAIVQVLLVHEASELHLIYFRAFTMKCVVQVCMTWGT